MATSNNDRHAQDQLKAWKKLYGGIRANRWIPPEKMFAPVPPPVDARRDEIIRALCEKTGWKADWPCTIDTVDKIMEIMK